MRIILPDGRSLARITDYILPGRITSLVGAGGKSSTMLTMGKELAGDGYSVIMTTSTKIGVFQEDLPEGLCCIGKPIYDEEQKKCRSRLDTEQKNKRKADRRLIKEEIYDSRSFYPDGITQFHKLGSLEDPDRLKDQCDYLLIEADGSRGLPIKAPLAHEPVITPESDLVIALAGLEAVGQPIFRVGHRVERICEVLKKKKEELLTPGDLALLLLSGEGLRKNVGNRRYAVVLNQADDERKIRYGREIASLLPQDLPCILTTYRS